jgi:hypothetical protein
MNTRTETMPAIVTLASASTWRPQLARATYIAACAVAMFGWTVALSWAALSFLWLLANQFT